MSKVADSEPYQIIWLIRRLFRALAQKSSENLEGLGVSVADRAVLEFLYPDALLAVPEIAERYQVSRQHVQVTVNSLLEKGLVVTRKNPRHRRSPHIALNTKGRKLFGVILAKDGEAVDLLFSRIPKSDVRITRHTLQALLDELDRGNSHA
jgi:DNA-binding MarR family transcriptional regulator